MRSGRGHRGRGGRGSRGGSRGSRGGGRRGGRGTNFTRRNDDSFHNKSNHLKQFGEQHPSQEMQDFEAASKRPRNCFDFKKNDASKSSAITVSDSDSDEEDESTPYTDLLTILSTDYKARRKAGVKVLSESESEEGEESSDANSDDVGDFEDAKSAADAGDVEGQGGKPEAIDPVSTLEDNEEAEVDLIEETVINEEELDSDFSDADDNDQPSNSESTDPFLLHFEREMPIKLQEMCLDNANISRTRFDYEWPETIGSFIFSGLTKENFCSDPIKENESGVLSIVSLDVGKCKWMGEPRIPSSKSPSCFQHTDPLPQSLFIKKQIQSHLISANKNCAEKSGTSNPLTPLQVDLLALMGNYHDLYFPNQSFRNEEEIRNGYCFHVANHITKVRSRILHHNARMANKVEVPDEFRDQGFVRPKVLILVPFKESALRIVKTLISTFLSEEKGNVQNKKRFVNEFSGETLFMPKTNPKPEDYMATFAGNVEDNFKIGLAITKKSIKLYTGFYSSDIIIASPLGLRLIVGAEGEKNRDYDFLSSVEVLVLDQADIFLMQNWDHMLHLMKHLHLKPLTTHGTDFGRIKPWAVDGLTKFYCQTLVFSSVLCPEHNALFSRHCKNFAGLAKVAVSNSKGTIAQITSQLPQVLTIATVFHQFESTGLADSSDARFNYFTEKVLPNFSGKLMSHTMIFVSSYFDFVRIRNYLRKEEKSFVQICEYTKDKKIARARDLFFHGKNHFLVYTERAHFFRRFRLKGIGHIIFYQLPQFPLFYSELCNCIQTEFQNRRVRQRNNSSVNVLYCKYDGSRLAAIVGDERCSHMLSSQKNVHAFVSGS